MLQKLSVGVLLYLFISEIPLGHEQAHALYIATVLNPKGEINVDCIHDLQLILSGYKFPKWGTILL